MCAAKDPQCHESSQALSPLLSHILRDGHEVPLTIHGSQGRSSSGGCSRLLRDPLCFRKERVRDREGAATKKGWRWEFIFIY
jgi:hypothetical protein